MHILLVNQYYPPDIAPTGQVLHDLACLLIRQGHEVQVVCSRHAYDRKETYKAEESLDGVQIKRVAGTGFGRVTYAGRTLDYLSYIFSLWLRIVAMPKPDIVLCMTTPPYVGVVAKLAIGIRRCKRVHWIMDLYPDVLEAHRDRMRIDQGQPRVGRRALWVRILEALTRFEFRGSRGILAIGPDMAARIDRYRTGHSSNEAKAPWVPLWGHSQLSPWPDIEPNRLRKARGWREDQLVLMYSGNMGMAHRLEEFLAAAEKTRSDETICWAFAGGGRRLGEVLEYWKKYPDENLKPLPYSPTDQLREHLCSADVHLLSQDSSWTGCLVPSKLQGCFSVGKPVIFVGPADCSLAHWIKESGGGWIVNEHDVDGLLSAINEAKDPQERKRRGAKARTYAEAQFDVTRNCQQVAKFFGMTG